MPVFPWVANSMGRRSDGEGVQPGASREGLKVLLHWAGPSGGDPWVTFNNTTLTAEEVCIHVAQKLGISPPCFSLFALFDAQDQVWLPPNHTLEVSPATPRTLHFRMRFYFRNWHGLNPQEPEVFRCGPRGPETPSEPAQQGLPLLDSESFQYLFEQGKYEFVNDVVSLETLGTEEETHHFKNESLGMASLHLCHLALCQGVSLEEVARKTSFKDCIPLSFRRQIREYNALTRLRLKVTFQRFLRTFQPTRLSLQQVMVKYLATLERLAPRFGSECVPVCHLQLQAHAALEPGVQSDPGPPTHEVLVSGTQGLQWRPIASAVGPNSGGDGTGHDKEDREPQTGTGPSGKKTRTHGAGSQPVDRPREAPWVYFCDFQDVTHVVLKDQNVSIHCQDKCLELVLPSRPAALSLVALVDGYFRLTSDSSHYLCHEVAPPRLVMSVQEGVHGPLL